MGTKYFSNRRITFRDRISIMGKITVRTDGRTFTENIEIEDITYDGMKIVFANNDFLFRYLDLYEKNDGEITTEFEYNGSNYSFKHTINWFRIYDMGERDYYILSSLKFKDRENFEKELVDLIISIQMGNFLLI